MKRRLCAGKRQYPTYEQARTAAAGMANRKAKQGNTIVTFLRAYGCSCGGYHVGRTREIDWSRVR